MALLVTVLNTRPSPQQTSVHKHIRDREGILLYLATIKGGRELASLAVAFEDGNDCAVDPGLVTECVSDVPGSVVIKRYAPRRMKFTNNGRQNGNDLANNYTQKHAEGHKRNVIIFGVLEVGLNARDVAVSAGRRAAVAVNKWTVANDFV